MIENKNMIGVTTSELFESFKNLQGKTLEDLFSKEELEELHKKYYVSFYCGVLFLGPKEIYITKNLFE